MNNVSRSRNTCQTRREPPFNSVDEFLTLLPDATRSNWRGTVFTASCPAHPEKYGLRSLTVIAANDIVRLECSKGCSEGRIILALGLIPGDLLIPTEKAQAARFLMSERASSHREEKYVR